MNSRVQSLFPITKGVELNKSFRLLSGLDLFTGSVCFADVRGQNIQQSVSMSKIMRTLL